MTLGIRPEDFLLESPEAPETLDANVVLIEPMGADKLIFCQIDGAHESSIRLPRHVNVMNGDMLKLKPRPNSVHLFNRKTGQRLNKIT